MGGAGLVQWKEPCRVTTDSDGLILIADTCNHCIMICDKIDNYMYCFGSKGFDDVEFNHPHGIIVGPSSYIWHWKQESTFFPLD